MASPLWYSIFSLLVLCVSSFLFNKAAGSLSPRKLNIVSWIFYYQLLLLSFIGITLGVSGTYHYMLNRASSTSIRLAYFAVCYVMIVMPLSMVIFQRIALGGGIRQKLHRYYATALHPLQSRQDSAQLIFWGVITGVAFLATLYTYYVIRELPFASLLFGSDSSFLSLRQSAKFGFTGNVYVRNYLSVILAPLVSYVAFAYALLRPTPLRIIWFLSTVLLALMASTYSGEKAPIIIYFLSLFIVHGLVRGRFNMRQLMLMGGVGTALIALLYLSTSGSVPLGLNIGPIGRLLFSQVAPLSLHFELFPQHLDFLRGASFPGWLSGLLGQEHLRSGRAVMEAFNARAIAAGEAGVLNTLFIGEAWANFGWYGFLLSPVIVGVVVQFLHNLLLSLKKAPVFIAVMTYFMFKIPVTGGFVDFLWNSGWVFLFLLLTLSLFARPLFIGAKRSSLSRS